jgi:beta-mannosidase
MEIIDTYMKREYKTPGNFERYNYISQIMQAYGVTKAIEAHRRAKPYCMGTLYWQLNDCWPVISWSGVDYYNRWKALHYFVREAYKPLLISFEKENDSLRIYIVSDEQKAYQANLELKLTDFEGHKLWSKTIPADIEKNSAGIFFRTGIKDFIKGAEPDRIVLSAKVIWKELPLSEKNYYFALPKNLNLPEPGLTKNIKTTPGGYRIILAADKLAKNVYLSIDEDGFFTDNFFDIMPGGHKVVEFKTDKDIDGFKEKLKVRTLRYAR